MSRPKVQSVVIQIAAPSEDDPGQICEGAYIVEDGTVKLTDRNGKLVRDGHGLTYSHKLRPEDNPVAIAGMLTRKLRNAFQNKGGRVAGFGAPIKYPSVGIA